MSYVQMFLYYRYLLLLYIQTNIQGVPLKTPRSKFLETEEDI